MTDINVDDFFRDAGRILTTLYALFPRPHAVFVDDIYAPEEPDEFGLHSDRYQACFGTMLWLADEGYLRYSEPIRFEAIDQAILTGRCFTLLSSPAHATNASGEDATLPELVRLERSTHIHRIRSALKARSSIDLRLAMIDLMRSMEGIRAPG